jgi:hypothetical protein
VLLLVLVILLEIEHEHELQTADGRPLTAIPQHVPPRRLISSQVCALVEWGITPADEGTLPRCKARPRRGPMQKRLEEHALPKQPQVITPASAQRTDGIDPADLEGYALHAGKARSTEDVTVRGGRAPLLARGEGAEEVEVEEELRDPTLASEVAPD